MPAAPFFRGGAAARRRNARLFRLPIVLALALAACAPDVRAPVKSAVDRSDHGAAVAVCAAAVAAHVGKPADAVAASWVGQGGEGSGVVAVTDAGAAGDERRHLCEVDANGRVRAIRHPRL